MKFNIRVYGLLIHQSKILLSDENRFNLQFTKFPGGGLEFNEGILDCIHREFQEELDISIKNPKLFYINETFVPSAFNKNDQIIAIYYLIESNEIDKIPLVSSKFDFKGQEQIFRFVKIQELNQTDFRFPIDREIIKKIKLI